MGRDYAKQPAKFLIPLIWWKFHFKNIHILSLCYCGVKHLLKEILFQIHINMKLFIKRGFLKHISRPPWLAQPQYLHCSTTAKHTIGDKIIRAEEVNDFDGRQQSSTVGRWPGAKSSPQSEKATCNAGQQKTL